MILAGRACSLSSAVLRLSLVGSFPYVILAVLLLLLLLLLVFVLFAIFVLVLFVLVILVFRVGGVLRLIGIFLVLLLLLGNRRLVVLDDLAILDDAAPSLDLLRMEHGLRHHVAAVVLEFEAGSPALGGPKGAPGLEENLGGILRHQQGPGFSRPRFCELDLP